MSAFVVLDAGKTFTKLTLWDEAGRLVERRTRANLPVNTDRYRALDAFGIETWVTETLRDFARLQHVNAIFPVGHGAAAAFIAHDRLCCLPMDYEQALPASPEYDAARDSFACTGSPALPNGLNLGRQLDWLEGVRGRIPKEVTILTWPQYWAWNFSGVPASEWTSLGSHTDLWRPYQRRPSNVSINRGWADRVPTLRYAGDVLDTLTRGWLDRTGLPKTCKVYCGIHDSNAALVAARAHPEIADVESCVVSTGTWFIAMRSVARGAGDFTPLLPGCDCLLNVDLAGNPVPSARFMGGREAELIGGIDTRHLTSYGPDELSKRLDQLVQNDVLVLPSFVDSVGPYGHRQGRWINEVADPADRRTMVELYLALVTDRALELIGARDRIVIEGRFAEATIFVRALATLRPQDRIYVSNAHNDLALGALKIMGLTLSPYMPLQQALPLEADLDTYRLRWRAMLEE